MKKNIIRSLALPAIFGLLASATAHAAPAESSAIDDGRSVALCDADDGHEHGKRGNKDGKRFQRADKNGDGFLTQDEVGEKRWGRIQVADANSDDRVTKDELKAARKAGKLGHKGKHGKKHGKRDHKKS